MTKKVTCKKGEDFVKDLEEIPKQKELLKEYDMALPIGEAAFAVFMGVARRRVEEWRRKFGKKGEHWDVFGGDVSLTRLGAIQCAGELGRGISVQNACSMPYVKREGHRCMMKGTCPNPRVVRAVKLSDGLIVIVRVRNPMDYPIGFEFMAVDNGIGGYVAASGQVDRRGW